MVSPKITCEKAVVVVPGCDEKHRLLCCPAQAATNPRPLDIVQIGLDSVLVGLQLLPHVLKLCQNDSLVHLLDLQVISFNAILYITYWHKVTVAKTGTRAVWLSTQGPYTYMLGRNERECEDELHQAVKDGR
jgi:hypothetical protein